MSLDISVPGKYASKPDGLCFDDDGCYWFCYPFFEELNTRTGEMIDLYGDATFEGVHLEALEETLVRIIDEARRMPSTWDVCVGYNVKSARNPMPESPIYRSIRREDLIYRVEQFLRLVSEARRRKTHVRCMGD